MWEHRLLLNVRWDSQKHGKLSTKTMLKRYEFSVDSNFYSN